MIVKKSERESGKKFNKWSLLVVSFMKSTSKSELSCMILKQRICIFMNEMARSGNEIHFTANDIY